MRTGRLLFPAVRWDPVARFGKAVRAIDSALADGVGGFIVFGGEAGEVRSLTTALRERSRE
ncbi:MAG: hypothetical protein PVH00_15780, partial [Gemmatimonadota bacterium]